MESIEEYRFLYAVHFFRHLCIRSSSNIYSNLGCSVFHLVLKYHDSARAVSAILVLEDDAVFVLQLSLQTRRKEERQFQIYSTQSPATEGAQDMRAVPEKESKHHSIE